MRCQFVPEAAPIGIIDDDAVRKSISSLVRSAGRAVAAGQQSRPSEAPGEKASGNDHVRKEALDHGAVAFLDKPFGDETLLNAMRLALAQ
jgi:hypothetical protein